MGLRLGGLGLRKPVHQVCLGGGKPFGHFHSLPGAKRLDVDMSRPEERRVSLSAWVLGALESLERLYMAIPWPLQDTMHIFRTNIEPGA